MEGLQEVTNAVLNGTIRDPLLPSLPLDQGSQPPNQHCNCYYLRNGYGYAFQIFCAYSQSRSEEKHIKTIWKNYPQAQSGSLKTFRALTYKAHRVWSSLRQHSFLVYKMLWYSIAEGLRDTLLVKILSTGAQIHEKSHLKKLQISEPTSSLRVTGIHAI